MNGDIKIHWGSQQFSNFPFGLVHKKNPTSQGQKKKGWSRLQLPEIFETTIHWTILCMFSLSVSVPFRT